MAQRKRGVRRRWRVAGGGISLGRAQVVACVLLVAVVAAVGAGLSLAAGGFEVERAAGSQPGQAGVDGAEEGDSSVGAEAQSSDVATDDAEAQAVSVVVVHVDGAVACPGVYELSQQDPRVRDAVEAAGGLTVEADTTGINLAATLTDGSKVHVPATGEVGSAANAGAAQVTGATSATVTGTGLVNINTATAEELDTLPGVGPSTAQAIVDDRDRNGPFTSPEDLMRVSGIGEKKFAKLEGSICV